MNKREANRILNGIDAESLQTARELMNQFIPTLMDGKWVRMDRTDRACYLIALALKIGERRGQRMAAERMAAAGTDGPATDTADTA